MKKAILYVRVSTDEQAEKGYSLRNQEEMLLAYCQIKEIEVKAIFREDHSAKNFNRPEYKKLLQYARDNKRDIDLLLFTKWDRFSRNAFEAYEQLRKYDALGIVTQATEQPIDTNIPETKIMQAIFLITPEVENDRRSINIKQGMRRKRKEGSWDCTAPKGYSNKRDESNKKIVVPNDDAKFIKEAFEEIAKGLKPYDHIRKELNMKGFVCSKSNFAKLIRNPFYIGKIRIPAYKDEKEEIIDGVHEPIVSEPLFYRVQDILDGRSKQIKKPKIHRHREELPLRGFLFCPSCNRKLTGSGSKGNGGRYFYYHCSHCKQTRFRADAAEKKLLRKLQSYSIDSEYSKFFLKVFNQEYKQQVKSSQTSLKSLQDKMASLQKRITSLQDKFADDLITSVDYHEIKNRYEQEIEKLKFQQAEAKVQRRDIQEMMEKVLSYMVDIDNHYATASLEVKQGLIGSIFTGNLYFEQNKLRTTQVNKVIEMVCKNRKALEGNKKRLPLKNQQQSGQVAPAGIEPASKV